MHYLNEEFNKLLRNRRLWVGVLPKVKKDHQIQYVQSKIDEINIRIEEIIKECEGVLA